MPLVFRINKPQNNEPSKQKIPNINIVIDPPSDMIIPPKVSVAIRESSQLMKVRYVAPSILMSCGNISPSIDQDIGPKPKLNPAKYRHIHVGGIQPYVSSYSSGSLSRALAYQPCVFFYNQ